MVEAGDIITLTAAVRDLHLTHPGRFLTAVRTSCSPLWDHNPYLTDLDEADAEVEDIRCDYPLIHRSNHAPFHMIHGFRMFLEDKLGVPIEPHAFHGDIHLSEREKSWMSQVEETEGAGARFWIIVSGGKRDFTAKWWDPDRAQQVVDHFRGRIRFVQCGEGGHHHPRLKRVIDLVGKTDLRQIVRLMWHADGVICPVTMFMHLAAAVETKPGRPRNRPCVVIAGGREPSQWEAYPHHQYLHVNGALPCCDQGGCWKSRVEPLGDGDPKDESLCLMPVTLSSGRKLPKCLDMIRAAHVIQAVEKYLEFDQSGGLAVDPAGAKGTTFMKYKVTREQVEDFGQMLAYVKARGLFTPQAFNSLHAYFRATDATDVPWSVGITSRKWHCQIGGTWAPAGEPPAELYMEDSVLRTLEQVRSELQAGHIRPAAVSPVEVSTPPAQAAPPPTVPLPQAPPPMAAPPVPPTIPPPRRCSNCGRTLNNTQKFCPICGIGVP